MTCSSDAGEDQQVCGLVTTMQAVGVGTWTGPSGISIEDPTSPNSIIAGSASGAYLLVWTVNEGPCVATDTVAVTFLVVPDPAFSYAQAIYCKGDMPPTPWVATPGGTFSAGNGLVIDPISGTIQPSSSTVGEHIILYTFIGLCPASAQTTIVIAESPDASWLPPASLCSNDDAMALELPHYGDNI